MWVDHNFIYSDVEKGTIMDLEMAKTSLKMADDLLKGIKKPLICDFTNMKSQTKECRDYYSSAETAQRYTACAIISTSIIGRVLANFYLGLNKPIIPTRFFTDEYTACIWADKFK